MDLVPVRVSTLRGDQKTNFDLYIKLGQKNILYIRKGDSFEGERLQRLKEKKLRKMFISVEQEPNYRQYLETNIEMAYNKNSGKDIQTRGEIIHGQQQANAEEVLENPTDVQTYNMAKDGSGKYVSFLLEENEAIKVMLNQKNTDKNLAHHGVTVSTLAVGLAAKLNVSDQEQLQTLALGGLLHDIGHTTGNYEVSRPLSEFAEEEFAAYREHPARGAKMTEELAHFDKGVISIIKQHHEFVDGSGFPEKLKQSKTDPNAVIISACESLERLLTYDGMSRTDAVKHLMIERVGQHPLDYIKHLQGILKELDN